MMKRRTKKKHACIGVVLAMKRFSITTVFGGS